MIDQKNQSKTKNPWYKIFCFCYTQDDPVEILKQDIPQSTSNELFQINLKWYRDRKPSLNIQGIPSNLDVNEYSLIARDVLKCNIPEQLQCYPLVLYSDIQPVGFRFQNDTQIAFLESLIDKNRGLTYGIDIWSQNILNSILPIIKAIKDNEYFINVQCTYNQLFKRAPSVFKDSHQEYNLQNLRNQKIQNPVNNIDIVFSSRNVRFQNIQVPDKILILPFESLQVKMSLETQKVTLTNQQKSQVINQVVTYFESIENVIVVFPVAVPYQDIIQIAQIIVEIYVNNQVYRTPQNKIFCHVTLITDHMQKCLAQTLKFGFDEQMIAKVSSFLQEELIYKYINQPKNQMNPSDTNLVKSMVDITDAHSLCDILINLENFHKNKILKSDVKAFLEVFSPILDRSFQLKHFFNQFLQKCTDSTYVIKEEKSYYDTIDLSKQIETFMDVQQQTVNNQLYNTQNQTLKKGLLESKGSLSKSNTAFQVMEAMSRQNSFPKGESFDFMMSNDFQEDNPFNLQNLDPRDSDPGWNDDDQRIDTDFAFKNRFVTDLDRRSLSKPSSLRRVPTHFDGLQKSEILNEPQKFSQLKKATTIRKQSD